MADYIIETCMLVPLPNKEKYKRLCSTTHKNIKGPAIVLSFDCNELLQQMGRVENLIRTLNVDYCNTAPANIRQVPDFLSMAHLIFGHKLCRI